MFIATLRDGTYDLVLFLHITCAIVGFGGVLLNPIYGAQAQRRPGPGGLAITEANFAVNKVAEIFIYAVPILGFGLVGLSDSACPATCRRSSPSGCPAARRTAPPPRRCRAR